MLEPSPETKHTQALLTNLVILTLVILGLILVIAGYPLLSRPAPPTPTTLVRQVLPTDTATITATETLSATPSRTPRNTFTSTPTLTRTKIGTPLPTFTPTGAPLLPASRPVAGKLYSLVKWTPEEADALVEYLNAYPNTLLNQVPKPDRTVYFNAFQYAVLAQREALLRFPGAEQASRWQWGLAYNQAQIDADGAAQAYADLVTRALNQGETDLQDLSSWFSKYEPRFSLSVIELEPTPGFLSSRLIQIHGAGSAFIWLLESTGAYQSQVLVNAFDFLNPGQMNTLIADLTGDGAPEVAIFSYLPTNASLQIFPPRVFDLAKSPAVELFYNPGQALLHIGVDFTNYWAIRQDSTGKSSQLFKSTVFPICPVVIQQEFTWNGQSFISAEPTFSVELPRSNLSYCDLIVQHAVQNWGPQATIQVLEQALPALAASQPDTNPDLVTRIKDEWRLRLALAYALTGNVEKARGWLEEIVAKPAQANSEWLASAQQLLQIYRTPTDVYQACIQSAGCIPAQAVNILINNHLQQVRQAQSTNEDALVLLGKAGAQIRAAGYFDFDLDGQKERWFTLRHRPFEKLELWILVVTKPGEQAIRLGNVDTDKPAFTYLDDQALAPVVFIDAQAPFQLLRDRFSQEAYIRLIELPTLYPDKFKLALAPLQEALLSGADPKEIRQKLLDLELLPGLLCKKQFTCDAYYYFLGLSSELAGDEIGAAKDYVTLWLNYLKSPYTIMARIKLVGGDAMVIVTPTKTYTATPSATSFLPTATPLPPRTDTPTPEDYPQPTDYDPYAGP